jgi:hypothetical protein
LQSIILDTYFVLDVTRREDKYNKKQQGGGYSCTVGVRVEAL